MQECEFFDSAELDRLGWHFKPSRDRRAGLLYAHGWAQLLRECVTDCDRFVLGVFGTEASQVIICSAYFPHHDRDQCDLESAEMLGELEGQIRLLKQKYRQASFCLLADANVELPPLVQLEVAGQGYAATGTGTKSWRRTGSEGKAERERKDRRQILTDNLLTFMQTWGLLAANTFDRRRPTWEPWGQERNRSRTRSMRRVLDYVMVPMGWEVQECKIDFKYRCGGTHNRSRLADHALVMCTVRQPSPGRTDWTVERVHREPSLVGWRAQTYADEMIGRERVDLEFCGAVFAGCGSPPAVSTRPQDVTETAPVILKAFTQEDVDYSTTSAARPRAPSRPPELTRLEERIRSLQNGPEKKRLRAAANVWRRQYRRDLLEWAVPPTRRKIRHRIKHVVVDGWETEDRYILKEKLEEHVKGKVTSQRRREENGNLMEEIRRKAEEEIKGGQIIRSITMSICCAARARLRTRRATGPDRVPCEMLKLLPWCTVRHIQQIFDSLLRLAVQYPVRWRDILIAYMPKLKGITNLADARLLCLQNSITRWFSACVVILVELHVEESKLFHPLGLYGFRQGHSTSHITSSLTNMCMHGDKWGKRECLYVADMDIYQAFDNCTIQNVHKGLEHARVPAYLQHAFLDPLSHSTGCLYYDGLEIDNIQWDTCIRTGGPEGPLGFNLIIAAMWGDVIHNWDVQGMGYAVDFGTEHRSVVNHFIWADNVYLVSRSREELTRMVRDLTLPLYNFSMRWKPTSLKYMVCGAPAILDEDGNIPRSMDLKIPIFSDACDGRNVVQQIDELCYRRVVSMDVLGTQLHSEYNCSVHRDVSFRLDCARRAFYSQAGYFRSHCIPLKDKLRRYQDRVQSLALYGMETTTADSYTLSFLHSFEGKCLKMMISSRKGPTETEQAYQQRRYHVARERFLKAGYSSLVQRYLILHWNFAKDIACFAKGMIVEKVIDLKATERTWRDSRMACLCFGPYTDRTRTLMSETMRHFGNWSEASSYKRRCRGTESIGQRSWQYTLAEFFGDDWWIHFAGSQLGFMQYVTHLCTQSMLQCFQEVSTCGPVGLPAYLAPSEHGEIQVSTDDSPMAAEKLAKRIALHNMKATRWNLEAPGIPLEVVGDSLLVVSWATGRWRADNKSYADRISKIINTLDGLCSSYNIRPPAPGMDLIRHDFREWNTRADVLTHQAREGQISSSECSPYTHDYETEFYVAAAIRAGFDGGVSSEGCGCGCWIDIGLKPRYWDRRDPAQLIWKSVFERAWLISPTTTVTDTELSALECIVTALPQVVLWLSQT